MANKKVKTDIPKAYEARDYEDRIYSQWEKSGFFNPDNLPGKRKETFNIALPLPNVTGKLHIGHASMLSYQDLMIRYHRLKGDKTLWLPGMDHAAIATQNVVEKEIYRKEKKTRHDLGRKEFLHRVDKFAEEAKLVIRNQLKKMGSSLDWSREKFTLDEDLSVTVRYVFKKMHDDGLIYRGDRVVNWCPRCHSTLADDEVEHKDEKAKLYYIKYSNDFVVATSRPETKLGDSGLAVNPKDKRYKRFVGQELNVDLAGHKIKVKVFADREVDQNFGTGVVGVTPAHSMQDYLWAKRYKLPIIKVIDEDGKMTAKAGKYQGLTTLQSREKFVKDLEKSGQLEKIEDYQSSRAECYRCGSLIEPLPSKQWFVDVNKKIPGRGKSLKQLASEVVKNGDIKIIPDRFKKTYFQWMDNLRDWCISRQIWYGHRIPVWYKGEEIYVGEKAPQGKGWVQDEDTLDTWFSSGLWTFSTLGWPKKTKDLKDFHPTSVLETMYDILFFWVARMIMMSTYLLGEKPFSFVYLHAMVKDKEGRKMSKSLGNGIDPIDIIKKYGADPLRLAMIIGVMPGGDVKLYEEKISGYRNFVNKLWNISRFILSSVGEVKTVSKEPKPKTLSDRWILAEFNNLIKEVTRDIEEFNFSPAGEKLYDFTWNKLADWYLEISKIEKNKDNILLYILERLLVLWHPFTPFVTEAIWQNFKTKSLLMINKWPKVNKVDSKALKDFKELEDLVIKIRNLKAENKIPPAELPNCHLESKKLKQAEFEVIAKLARVSLVDKLPKAKSFATAHSRVWINLAKEMSDRERKDLEKYIKSLEAKLNNDKFVKNAPAKVVEDVKEKLRVAKKKLE